MLASTRGRYALRAMVDIAENNRGDYIPLKEVAKRQEISEKYLESILSSLTKAGILEGLRGKGGGYRLAAAPRPPTVRSVLEVVEGKIFMVPCLQHKPSKCRRSRGCPTLSLWQKLQSTVETFLDNVTIADLCKPKPGRGRSRKIKPRG